MEDKQPSDAWQARNEEELTNALEVMYEMATGFVLGELRQTAPDVYDQLTNSTRKRNQLINNVRYSVDTLVSDILADYIPDKAEPEA